MLERYCPGFGPGSSVCPPSICDCFIDQFPDDMEQAGALHPEFYRITPRGEAGRSGVMCTPIHEIGSHDA